MQEIIVFYPKNAGKHAKTIKKTQIPHFFSLLASLPIHPNENPMPTQQKPKRRHCMLRFVWEIVPDGGGLVKGPDIGGGIPPI